jgi:hypothetical protein
MKEYKSAENWGRGKARERYAVGGQTQTTSTPTPLGTSGTSDAASGTDILSTVDHMVNGSFPDKGSVRPLAGNKRGGRVK